MKFCFPFGIAIAVLGSMSPVHAQKPAPISGLSYVGCKDYLTCSVNYANAQHKAISKSLSDYNRLGKGYDLCVADKLEFLKAYYQWTLTSEAEIRKAISEFSGIAKKMEAKLDYLTDIQIETLPTETQKETRKVSFRDIGDYLVNLNERIEGCKTKDQVDALIRRQELPERNKLGLSHSQIIAAIEKSNVSINASLKEQPGDFSVKLVRTADSKFDYVLNYKPKINDSVFTFDISLLNKTQKAFNLTDSDIWKILTDNKMKIGGYSVDGQVRFVEMQKALREPSCRTENWHRAIRQTVGLPLVSERTVALRKNNIAEGPKSNVLAQEEFCEFDVDGLVAFFNANSSVTRLTENTVWSGKEVYGGIIQMEGDRYIRLNRMTAKRVGHLVPGGKSVITTVGGEFFSVDDMKAIRKHLSCDQQEKKQ